jgi:RHS repeat-associated protein
MLGSEKFISWIKDRFFKKKKDKQVPTSKQLAPDLDTIISEVIRYYKIKPTNLKTVHRGIENESRDVAMYLIRSLRAVPLMRIGENFGLTQYNSVSSVVIRIKAKLQKDKKFRARLQDIENNILKVKRRLDPSSLNKGSGIGGLLVMRQGGLDCDYLYDGKGNVSAVIDSTQAVVASYRYDVFGRLKVTTGALDQPYQFSTKRYLAGVGLNYYGYRYYAPAIGRCLDRDPLGEAGGINLYGFAPNNPVNYLDPLGLSYLNDNSSTNLLKVYSRSGKLIDAFSTGNRGSNPWSNGTYSYRRHNPHADDGG